MKKMKGVILAGGSGTRLHPNTKVTNKHLLPVYNQPMIYYPIQTMLKAGISDILILPGKDNAGDFAKLLGSGKDFNCNFEFKVQDHAGGLAYAVGLAENFVGDDNFVVIFGDNIIEDNIIKEVQGYEGGAVNFLKQVHDPKRFGIAELEGDRVVNIVEKPQDPKSDWAVIGLYIYDSRAFQYIKTLQPSARGELEITDLNNIYIRENAMKAAFLQGYWFDAGTHESLVDAAYALRNYHKPIEPLKHGEKNAPKIVIGGILYDRADMTYTTSKYLRHFLESVQAQDYQNIDLVFVDNSEKQDNENVRIIKEVYPQAEVIFSGDNIGFAKANNILIKKSLEKKADYFVCSNVDMLYEPNVVSELLNSIMKSPQVGSSLVKIRRWNFAELNNGHQGKTNYIDSTGIQMTKEHRFMDRGQGEIDFGQYDQEQEVFGASGACVMYRLSALDDVAFVNESGEKEYFDELMLMYKEDVDLSYRLQLAGYKCQYNPAAIVYHDRSVSAGQKGIINIIKSRSQRSQNIREWSWMNHQIILQKMLDNSMSSDIRFKTWLYGLKTGLYLLVFEPHVLLKWKELWKMRKQIAMRREQLKKRIDVKKHLEKLISE